MRRRARRRSTAREYGFTLVELLVVIAMVGVLATIGLVGYQKYVSSAGASEATAVIQSIRAAEELYRAETLVYLGCSGCGGTGCAPGAGNLNTFYPQLNGKPDTKKWHWVQPNHPDFACWQLLNVMTDHGVRFGYAVVAGSPDVALPATALSTLPAWPKATEPWYVIQAAGDRDGDSRYALFVGASFAFGDGSGVYSENDTE